VRALVARAAGAPLGVEQVRLPGPGPGQVRVRIRAAGVCHSDLSMVNGTLAPSFPLVLGHEAAGEVTEVGAGVTRVRPGDHAVLSWSPACRQCWFCDHGEPWLCERSGAASTPRGSTEDGTPLHVTLGLGALADEVVVGEEAVIAVPAELAWHLAALLGCAVLTGVGAVRNTGAVRPGESVLVVGLGGVGLTVLTQARAEGADPVLAADLGETKRDLAYSAGASSYLPAGDDLPKAVRAATGGRGVDVAFECVGRATTIRTAWRCARRGGRVVVVGMGGRDDLVSLSALEIFHSARTLRSSVYGAADPDRDVPLLAQAVLDRTLPLEPLVSHRISLAEAPAAFERMQRGEGARSVVLFD
jgi:S-(hydroxymethyl)glutathione dehydrogenase / alcohol dehydrogenase